MAEEQNPAQTPGLGEADAGMGAAAGDQAQRQFTLQKQYMKDASFEVPNAPQIFQETGKPEYKMNLAQRVAELGENLHEVVLTLTITATMGEKTIYLVEVHESGVFHIAGFSEQEQTVLINTMCPHYLFPYARSAINGMVTEGGFPPPPIQPVNFDQVYASRVQQSQQGAAEGGEAEEAPAA